MNAPVTARKPRTARSSRTAPRTTLHRRHALLVSWVDTDNGVTTVDSRECRDTDTLAAVLRAIGCLPHVVEGSEWALREWGAVPDAECPIYSTVEHDGHLLAHVRLLRTQADWTQLAPVYVETADGATRILYQDTRTAGQALALALARGHAPTDVKASWDRHGDPCWIVTEATSPYDR